MRGVEHEKYTSFFMINLVVFPFLFNRNSHFLYILLISLMTTNYYYSPPPSSKEKPTSNSSFINGSLKLILTMVENQQDQAKSTHPKQLNSPPGRREQQVCYVLQAL